VHKRAWKNLRSRGRKVIELGPRLFCLARENRLGDALSNLEGRRGSGETVELSMSMGSEAWISLISSVMTATESSTVSIFLRVDFGDELVLLDWSVSTCIDANWSEDIMLLKSNKG
jgi:hypothetical protein